MEVKERIAYVRGLMDGSGAASDPSSRMLWDNLLQVCDGLADSVRELSETQSEFAQYIEAIDEDLGELEEEFYGVETELEDDETLYDEAEEHDEDHLVRAECPRCGEEAFFDEAYLYDESVEISCPECGEILYRGKEHHIEDYDNNEHIDEDPLYSASDRAEYGTTPFSSDN